METLAPEEINFRLTNKFTPDAILEDQKLNVGDVLVCMYLFFVAEPEKNCCLSQAMLAMTCKLSNRVAWASIRTLADLGYIQIASATKGAEA